MDTGVKRRKKYKPSRRPTLRHFEGDPADQEWMWGITRVVTERVLCVRDLARLLVAVGTLDVDEALARIAQWKRVEAMYKVEAERPY